MTSTKEGASRPNLAEANKRADVADGLMAQEDTSRHKDAAEAQPASCPETGFAWDRWRNPDADALDGNESDASPRLRQATRSVRPRTALPESGQPPGRPPGTV